jgi:hypothetical protein
MYCDSPPLPFQKWICQYCTGFSLRVNTYDILAGMHPQPDESPYLNKIQLFLVITAYVFETKKIPSGIVLFGEILTKQSYLTVKVSIMKAR